MQVLEGKHLGLAWHAQQHVLGSFLVIQFLFLVGVTFQVFTLSIVASLSVPFGLGDCIVSCES